MVKKIHNPLKIDYKKCVIEDRLLQVKDLKNVNIPELIKVWTIEIAPRDSKAAIDFIRRRMQCDDPVSLQHLKRIKKTDDQKRLKVILCSLKYIDNKEELIKLLAHSDINYVSLDSESEVPLFGPSTKKLIVEWSQRYWPLTWNGNPNDQILNAYTFDLKYIKKILTMITERAKEEVANGNKYPIVSAFADPKDKNHILIAVDTRCAERGFILEHSIMNGINEVSTFQKEQKVTLGNLYKGTTYLCVDFDVYTTHEPCSMCAMALVHSRVKRCIFIEPMETTGSLNPKSGNGYCMHNNKTLNSKYEVFQWIGNEYDVPKIVPGTCC